ncbi:MAG: BrnA antitoxin family protein [Ardenticatenia bacterium]|nr:BrnA antitoxin family protein [Ardenticatenia bacterium]
MNPEPVFANEDAERAYWAKEDLTDQFDWESAVEPSLPELRPSTVSISIRLPISLLEDLKSLANARDVSYQSLMKILLAEQVAQIRRG